MGNDARPVRSNTTVITCRYFWWLISSTGLAICDCQRDKDVQFCRCIRYDATVAGSLVHLAAHPIACRRESHHKKPVLSSACGRTCGGNAKCQERYHCHLNVRERKFTSLPGVYPARNVKVLCPSSGTQGINGLNCWSYKLNTLWTIIIIICGNCCLVMPLRASNESMVNTKHNAAQNNSWYVIMSPDDTYTL